MYLAQPVIVGIPGVLPKGRNYDPVHPDEQRVIESFGITAPPTPNHQPSALVRCGVVVLQNPCAFVMGVRGV
jgi:hypothetical protein